MKIQSENSFHNHAQGIFIQLPPFKSGHKGIQRMIFAFGKEESKNPFFYFLIIFFIDFQN